MTSIDILNQIGTFSRLDVELFDRYTSRQQFAKNDLVWKEGEVCKTLYFALRGSLVQVRSKDPEEQVIDLHTENEWVFNQESLTEQSPSGTMLRAFTSSELLCLSLQGFHSLCAQSQAFLQFGKILNQPKYRTLLYDRSLSPAEKYTFITQAKPDWIRVFPLKMIASFLKVTPETVSRVRANPNIS